jgi:hypothetical protein
MSWKDLLAAEKPITIPWTGGRNIRAAGRSFTIRGVLPPEHGWHTFEVQSKNATWSKSAEPVEPSKPMRGYLVGHRFVPDDIPLTLDPADFASNTQAVWLVEAGLARFARVRALRWEDGKIIYLGQEFPTGPESEVDSLFLDRAPSVSHVKGVTPSLEVAFRMESWIRQEQERRREEAERRARELEERRALEERRRDMANRLGTGQGRRDMARVDFGAAARAALAVGGAELLDWRDAYNNQEAIVRFRYQGRRFECVCRKDTLQITDAGICLRDENTGERGDSYFTLESLTAAIHEAMEEGVLVVFRHA